MHNEGLEPNNEKRMDGRSNCKGIIKWSYFNHRNFFGGELLNLLLNTSTAKIGVIFDRGALIS